MKKGIAGGNGGLIPLQGSFLRTPSAHGGLGRTIPQDTNGYKT